YRQLFSAKGQNPALLAEAESFHSSLDDFGANPPPVPYTLLTADHRPTAVEVREYPCGFSQNGLCDDQIRFSLGDGTVPWLSAVAGTNAPNGSAGTVSVCTFHQDSLGGEVEHSTLLSAPAVIMDVKRILLNLAPVNCEGLPAAAGQSETSAGAPAPWLQVTAWGDVSAVVLNQANNALGWVNDVFTNTLPGAAYVETDGGLSLRLPVSATYTLTLRSLAAQFVLVRVTDYRAAGPGEVFNPYQSAVFIEVPLVVSGTAQLSLDDAAGLAGLQLQLFDAQGAPAAALPPTSLLDQPQAQDYTPPLTTMAVQGTQTAFAAYTGPVTVTLSVADSGVGVLATDYSLDAGQTWQAYTAPLVVVAEQVPVVWARSMDLAGNQEYPGVSQRLQPLRLYLPIVGR
ncbi:MAG: hypothetical protein JNK29_01960, partial [Anaerolineales bacterium]|nr:hypothetical protein [Anaerolineales bacterium]